MAAHRKLAAEFGHQAEAVVRAARERQQTSREAHESVDRVRESLTFSRDKNFEREAVVDERALIRDGLRRGMGEVTFSGARQSQCSARAGEFQVVERPHLPGPAVHDCKDHRRRAGNPAQGSEGQNQLPPVLPRLRPSHLPTRIPISTARRGALLKMFSAHRIACRASRATRGPARRRPSRLRRAALRLRDMRSKALLQPRVLPGSSARRRRDRNAAGVPGPGQPPSPEQEAFLFRGRIEPGKHEPSARIPRTARAAGPRASYWRHAPAPGR